LDLLKLLCGINEKIPISHSHSSTSLTKGLLVVWPLFWILIKFFPEKFKGNKYKLKSLLWGILSGMIIVGIGCGLFLNFKDFFVRFVPEFSTKAKDFGLLKPQNYILFSVLFSLFHALLEEYYWRWFVFGGLLKYFSPVLAGIIASVGFGLHHFIVLAQYFPLWTTLLLGIAVIGGGMFWCMLYYKTKTILGSWISHIFVDAVIMGIGYLLLF